MTLLAFFGIFQIIILLLITAIICFYIFGLIKLWNSNLPVSNKVLYTLLVLFFPLFGLLILFLVHRGIFIKVSELKETH